MAILILGLIVFLGGHSLRIVAGDWRARQVTRLGEARWKLLYSVIAFAGLALIVWGYGEARTAPVPLWQPPVWTRHFAALLTLPAFILVAAAYVPGTRIKAAIGHPMVAGVALWALAHLLANGTLADLLLFGGFLAWAVVDFASARRRDRAAGQVYAKGPAVRDAAAVAAGTVAWLLFALYLHLWWIGVRPF